MILTMELSEIQAQHIEGCDRDCYSCENTHLAMRKIQTAIAVARKSAVSTENIKEKKHE